MRVRPLTLVRELTLTVTDPDGDDLKIGLGSSPRHGVANVLASPTGPGRYNVDLGE